MSETLDNVNNPQAGTVRPVFLTVLCILSFVGAGISIVLVLLGTLFATAATVVTSSSSDVAMTSEARTAAAEVGNAVGNMWGYLIAAVILIVVSLIGVIRMWKLKKSGFYMYVVAAVAGIIVDIALGAGMNIFGIIVSIAFIVMYGVNLKAMR